MTIIDQIRNVIMPAVAVFSFCMIAAAPVRAAERPPNVLLIMTDDQGWGDIRSHGNDKIDTPVMDRIAADGARFDRFYVSPVCSPTRAALLTGRYPLRTGTHGVTRAWETMRDSETTLAEVMKNAGYATGAFGKWHNGAHYPQHPNGQGFDEFFGFCGGHWNTYFDADLEHNGRPVQTKGYISDVLTDAATQFIKTHRGRPWFCYVPYNAPHSPWRVPDVYFDKYKTRGLDDQTACAYAMVENLDDNIGRLLKTLDAESLAKDTLILFLTDNGPNSDRFNGDMKGRKGSVHEGGVRVPLFIRWPDHITPGILIRPIAAHIDLLPTIVDLCGIPLLDALNLDGVSLAPLLNGKTDDWPERTLFTHRFNGGDVAEFPGAVRTQRWRAVRERKQWNLYDMLADPAQKKDVAAQHPDILEKLTAAYTDWYRDVTRADFDPIPVQVGHADWPVVELPAHESHLHPAAGQGIAYVSRPGFANSWITRWTSTDAYPAWPLNVVRPGRHTVSLLYTCAKESVGAKLRVGVANRSVQGIVQRPHDPQPRPSPDRIPREIHYETKDWAMLDLGIIDLPQGATTLAVNADAIPGPQAIDLKAVRLQRIDDRRTPAKRN
jgi:arylsulfatase A